jgi:transposase
VTGIVDLDAGRLVDVLPARSVVAVNDWLETKPTPWLGGIRHVVIDPYSRAPPPSPRDCPPPGW